ncbi:hypothetical protein [Streptomyces mirabilis]
MYSARWAADWHRRSSVLPSSTFGTSPAQGCGLGGRGLAAALYASVLERGRRSLGLRERPATELTHRPLLPLHRLRDSRVDTSRGRDTLWTTALQVTGIG